MKRRTKIVCTLGPAVDSKEKVQALIEAGMNVARLNCSHGDWEQKGRWIEWIRELSPDTAPVAILADLQGPKFRVGEMPEGGLHLVPGQVYSVGPEGQIPIHQPEILKAMGTNGRLLLGDGEIELRIVDGKHPNFQAKVVTGGTLKSHKGVTLVGKVFEVAPITPKDREDIQQALDWKVDFIALSYVHSASDIRDLRRIVAKRDPSVGLCAKIETREATKELGEILDVADLIMVARGDMGLQMDIEDVPVMQKRIIDHCTLCGVPVITATQMLESMISNPRPTRAEASDVFNAILDGTDAVMLSGETAAGQYPVECVRTMGRIAEEAEAMFDRTKIDREWQNRSKNGVLHTDAIAHAASELARLIKPAAIVTTTTSGQTPRLVSKFRPKVPILCATWDRRTQAKMAVVWGVEAILVDSPGSTEDTVDNAVDAFFRRKRLKVGDQVVITAGVPAGTPGNTNMILTQTVK
jgi:pyruvate kinase